MGSERGIGASGDSRASRLRRHAGALAERDFRLLFAATTVTTAGDAIALVALAFAVLQVGSASSLGYVLGASKAVQAVVLLLGGVVADRLPRHLVLVGASPLQGAAQAATAALALSSHPSLFAFVAAQCAYGVGAGLIIPAEV